VEYLLISKDNIKEITIKVMNESKDDIDTTRLYNL